jgi:hypothetical protein
MRNLIIEAEHRIEDDLRNKLYFHVSADKVKFYNDTHLFGHKVSDQFPNATEDIAESGKCLALDRPTAAVFHLMRVMEIAVQRFGDKVGVELVKEKQWQVILDQINKAIKLMDHRLPETKKMAEAAAQLYVVKVAWRNEVMHPKQTYTVEEAETIFVNARTFVRELARVV